MVEVKVAGAKMTPNGAETALAHDDGGVAQGERGCGGNQAAGGREEEGADTGPVHALAAGATAGGRGGGE